MAKTYKILRACYSRCINAAVNEYKHYFIVLSEDYIQQDYTVKIGWGRIGAKVTEKLHEFDTLKKAEDFYEDILSVKFKKGYKSCEIDKRNPRPIWWTDEANTISSFEEHLVYKVVTNHDSVKTKHIKLVREDAEWNF